MFTKFLLKYILWQEQEICIPLGTIMQEGSLIVYIPTVNIWKKETLLKKIKSILKRNWSPSEHVLKIAAKDTFYEEIFGLPSDYNEGLFTINVWHNSQKWDLEILNDDDKQKAKSIDTLTVLVRT